MGDIFTKIKRSEVMSLVRGTGNKSTEMQLIGVMRFAGVTGWRRCQKLPGSPDFIFRKQRVAVFVDGCFWHVCPVHATYPKQNVAFWKSKLEANQLRDRKIDWVLRAKGWLVLRIWEHELKQKDQSLLAVRIKTLLSRRTKEIEELEKS